MTTGKIVDAREVVGEFFRSGCEPAHRHAHFSSLKEADALLTALRAAGYEVVPGWQPIETAPRNAEVILIFYEADDRAWPAQWHEEWVVPDSDDPPLRQEDVTHWRPLPAPPATKDTET